MVIGSNGKPKIATQPPVVTPAPSPTPLSIFARKHRGRGGSTPPRFQSTSRSLSPPLKSREMKAAALRGSSLDIEGPDDDQGPDADTLLRRATPRLVLGLPPRNEQRTENGTVLGVDDTLEIQLARRDRVMERIPAMIVLKIALRFTGFGGLRGETRFVKLIGIINFLCLFSLPVRMLVTISRADIPSSTKLLSGVIGGFSVYIFVAFVLTLPKHRGWVFLALYHISMRIPPLAKKRIQRHAVRVVATAVAAATCLSIFPLFALRTETRYVIAEALYTTPDPPAWTAALVCVDVYTLVVMACIWAASLGSYVIGVVVLKTRVDSLQMFVSDVCSSEGKDEDMEVGEHHHHVHQHHDEEDDKLFFEPPGSILLRIRARARVVAAMLDVFNPAFAVFTGVTVVLEVPFLLIVLYRLIGSTGNDGLVTVGLEMWAILALLHVITMAMLAAMFNATSNEIQHDLSQFEVHTPELERELIILMLAAAAEKTGVKIANSIAVTYGLVGKLTSFAITGFVLVLTATIR